MARPNIQNLYETASRLMRREAFDNLRNLLLKLHETEIAEILQRFAPPKQDQLLNLIISSDKIPYVFLELGPSFLNEYLRRHENYKALAKILSELSSDEKAELIADLDEDISEEILKQMEQKQSDEVSELLQYQENSAGRIMATAVFKVEEETTVAETIQLLQQNQDFEMIYYIYVVDDLNNLVGVLSIRQLFQGNTDKQLKQIMLRDLIRVRVDEEQEEVARLVAQYDLIAIPVVDDNNKLLGVITVDDVIDVIQEEAQESLLKASSTEIEALEDFSLKDSFVARLPWFAILLLSGIITWEVIDYFYNNNKMPIEGYFAGFIPLLLRFSGIISRQVSTITVQKTSQDPSNSKLYLKVFKEQLQLVCLISLLSSLLIGFYSYFRFNDYGMAFSLSVSLSLVFSMLLSLSLAIILPFVFKSLRLDPTILSGYIMNFLLDLTALLIYFNLLSSLLKAEYF